MHLILVLVALVAAWNSIGLPVWASRIRRVDLSLLPPISRWLCAPCVGGESTGGKLALPVTPVVEFRP